MNSELRSRARSTLKQIVELAMVTSVDPHHPLWRVFWADVVELAVAFTLETTAGDLDDIIDHIWARITQGQKPHQEHRALHHFLLVTARLDKSEHLETILMLYGSATKLPRVQDRATTLAIFSVWNPPETPSTPTISTGLGPPSPPMLIS